MYRSMPIPELLDAWLAWAQWVTTPDRDESRSGDLVGFDEFGWIVQEEPEKAWAAILAAVADPRCRPFLGNLAAGPLEDLLSLHGDLVIERVEHQARADPGFAWVLGGVWRYTMTDVVRDRVQQVRDRRGWDGIPA
jgi:hypothetical protein